MHDVRFMKRKWLQQFRFIIETDFVNASPGKFEEILDDEAQGANRGLAAISSSISRASVSAPAS
jgi:hypothetical protein